MFNQLENHKKMVVASFIQLEKHTNCTKKDILRQEIHTIYATKGIIQLETRKKIPTETFFRGDLLRFSAGVRVVQPLTKWFKPIAVIALQLQFLAHQHFPSFAS